jgi:hypothetical protein
MTGGWIALPRRSLTVAMTALGLAALGCQPPRGAPQNPPGDLPPAYTSNQITDPAQLRAAEAVRAWAAGQTGIAARPLYSKIEVLPPVPIVQPYGVGIYQEELRLPVILTTGPGWKGIPHKGREARAAEAFREIAARLKPLNGDPPLQLTLTIQTPEGMELAWINHLDPDGRNVHGDE